MAAAVGAPEVTVGIGGIPICVRTDDPAFSDMLQERYAGFVCNDAPRAEFDVKLLPPAPCADEDVQVRLEDGVWALGRGDFRAGWDPRTGKGWVRQTLNPFSIDTVLRIVHSLMLVQEGGFLLHASSAVRNGRAFLFSGVSGAGKTTMARLAPADATLLTDEISYVRRDGPGYRACGTPFAGELGRPGENVSAPVAALFFLAQGPVNRLDPVAPPEAARNLLRNTLFFAEDADLVAAVFGTALEFVERVPTFRLTFLPDQRVWDLVQ
jgi:hypothetical protein